MRGYNFRLAGALYEAGSWYDQGLGVYRAALRISRDDGKSWMQYLLSDAMSAAYCVAPDPSDMNIVYVGGEESKPNGSYPVMFKTTNGGSSWSRIATNITNYSGDRFRLLEIDKKNPSKIFAATSNSVYISTDRGVSWGAGKTINYASSLLIDPANSQNVYLGCSDGVFASQNGGTTWTDISRNLLCKNVEALEYDSHNQVLYAGTVYGGVFRMVLNPLVSVESSGPAAEYGLDQNYPNPFNPVTTISYRLTAASEVRLEVVDVLGKVVQVLDEGHRAAGGYSVRWDASGFPSGVYFCQLQARPTDGGQAGSLRQTRRMILMK